MDVYKIKKVRIQHLLKAIAKDSELIAPTNIKFETLKPHDVDKISLGKNTYIPAKGFFFKDRQEIFKFKDNNMVMPKLNSPERVFFGIRRCDLNAIKHQDKIYMEIVKDPYYIAARKNSYLLGYHCNVAPSKYCFCGTLGLTDFYDMMFYDKKDHYLVEIGSEKGKVLLKKYHSYFTKTNMTINPDDKKIKNADRLLKDDIKPLYDNPDWQKGVNQCLSCGACTTMCPTCYCFEFHDNVDTTLKQGNRVRGWSSCQLTEFTKISGEHIYRHKRDERFKHRIYHQLQYYKDRYGINLCVGCGRCIESCPTRIDFIDIINKMK